MTAPEPTVERPKYARALALEVARELCVLIAPLCVSVPGESKPRIKVVGSLRRGKEEVKDIEILYISREGMRPNKADLFQEPAPYQLTDELFEQLIERGRLAKRPNIRGGFSWGAENKLAVHLPSLIPVDLFAATRENWFNLVVCRTGGKDSNLSICNAAIARGMKWNTYGEGFTGRQGELIRVNSEEDAFKTVGLPHLPPEERK